MPQPLPPGLDTGALRSWDLFGFVIILQAWHCPVSVQKGSLFPSNTQHLRRNPAVFAPKLPCPPAELLSHGFGSQVLEHMCRPYGISCRCNGIELGPQSRVNILTWAMLRLG